MGSFSGVGIGLCFVLGCVLMGLVGAELYYLFWWKKRSSSSTTAEIQGYCFLLCWRKPSRGTSQELTNTVSKSQEQQQEEDLDMEMGSPKIKDLGMKSSTAAYYGEEAGVESTEMIMRMHNLSGPPRFLFTIREEGKEDLESSSDDDDDGKSSRKATSSTSRATATRSLSDLIFAAAAAEGTDNGTPSSSPPQTTTTHRVINTNPHSLDSFYHHGINPLFESLSEAELNRLRSSPPPKLKFLKDAEDKLIIKRLLVEEAERTNQIHPKTEECGVSPRVADQQEVKTGSFVSFLNRNLLRDQQGASSAQVLPLSSSPTFQTTAASSTHHR